MQDQINAVAGQALTNSFTNQIGQYAVTVAQQAAEIAALNVQLEVAQDELAKLQKLVETAAVD